MTTLAIRPLETVVTMLVLPLGRVTVQPGLAALAVASLLALALAYAAAKEVWKR